MSSQNRTNFDKEAIEQNHFAQKQRQKSTATLSYGQMQGPKTQAIAQGVSRSRSRQSNPIGDNNLNLKDDQTALNFGKKKETSSIENRNALLISSDQMHQPLPDYQPAEETNNTSQHQDSLQFSQEIDDCFRKNQISEKQVVQKMETTNNNNTINTGHNININIKIDHNTPFEKLQGQNRQAMPISIQPSIKLNSMKNTGVSKIDEKNGLPTDFIIDDDYKMEFNDNGQVSGAEIGKSHTNYQSENIQFNDNDEYQSIRPTQKCASESDHDDPIFMAKNQYKSSHQHQKINERKNLKNEMNDPLHFRNSSQKFMNNQSQTVKVTEDEKATMQVKQETSQFPAKFEADVSNKEDAKDEVQSAQSQSNQVDDLDEQKLKDLKVHKINKRQNRLNITERYNQKVATQQNNDLECIEELATCEFDDLANESANVIEFTQTGHSLGSGMVVRQNES